MARPARVGPPFPRLTDTSPLNRLARCTKPRYDALPGRRSSSCDQWFGEMGGAGSRRVDSAGICIGAYRCSRFFHVRGGFCLLRDPGRSRWPRQHRMDRRADLVQRSRDDGGQLMARHYPVVGSPCGTLLASQPCTDCRKGSLPPNSLPISDAWRLGKASGTSIERALGAGGFPIMPFGTY